MRAERHWRAVRWLARLRYTRVAPVDVTCACAPAATSSWHSRSSVSRIPPERLWRWARVSPDDDGNPRTTRQGGCCCLTRSVVSPLAGLSKERWSLAGAVIDQLMKRRV